VSDAGRQRESRSVHPENAQPSSFTRFESESNATEHKLVHSLKQYLPKNRTELGMEIEFSEEQLENALS
jgi:hypothetical protein